MQKTLELVSRLCLVYPKNAVLGEIFVLARAPPIYAAITNAVCTVWYSIQ